MSVAITNFDSSFVSVLSESLNEAEVAGCKICDVLEEHATERRVNRQNVHGCLIEEISASAENGCVTCGLFLQAIRKYYPDCESTTARNPRRKLSVVISGGFTSPLRLSVTISRAFPLRTMADLVHTAHLEIYTLIGKITLPLYAL